MLNLTNKIKTSKFSRNKITSIAIAIFLMLSMTASLVLLPSANAHTPAVNIPTDAYVVCAPGTVGVGQYTSIVVFLDRYSPTNGGITGQLLPGFQLNITKPDGSTIIIGPWTCSSAVASDYKIFTPDEVGTYTIVFSWPGATVAASNSETTSTAPDVGDYLEGSTSAPTTLVVQQSAVLNWPEPPLPTDYWTLPINSQDRTWSTLASNWLKGTWLVGSFQTEGTGPTSAHVLWTEPIMASSPSGRGYPGGIADAAWPGISNNINDYTSSWSAPIIMNGVIYYNAPATAQSDKYGYYAVDLYTGNELWFKNGTDNGLNNPYSLSAYTGAGGITAPNSETFLGLTLGQLYHYDSVNGNGVASYLWIQSGTTWYMLDASTGNLICTLIHVPSGTAATDQSGDLLLFSYNAATGNLLCWNSSQAIYPGGPTGTGQQCWRPPMGSVIDAVNDTAWINGNATWAASLDTTLQAAISRPHSGYTMNVTMPTGLPGSMSILENDQRTPEEIFGSAVTTTYGSIGGSCTGDNIAIWLATINSGATSYSPWPTLPSTENTNLGFTVTMDYNKTITVPLPGLNYTWAISAVNYDSQVFFVDCQQTSQRWCYSLATGAELWGPTASTLPMGYYDQGGGGVYNGVFLGIASSFTFEGEILAYNVTTGSLMWIYNSTAAPYSYESEYGNNMPLTLAAVCNGLLYVYSTEHSPTNPLWRESYVRCINMTDGTLIWKIQDYNMGLGIADGYLVTASQYDNTIYCIGKGPSATTVSAPQNVPSLGSSVMITGMVTDQSPGAKADGWKLGYANGVPAVSDASQEGWMEYLYEQQAIPTNATGVPVSLAAIDPNGNYINIGTATTDLTGAYGTMFTPQVPGTYQIIATFAPTNSYSGSSAQTYLGVGSAPVTPAPTATPLSASAVASSIMVPLVIVAIAIIIAIAIVGVLMLRKHA